MLAFIFGCMTGGVIGVFVMCLCFVSGQCSREEERRDKSE